MDTNIWDAEMAFNKRWTLTSWILAWITEAAEYGLSGIVNELWMTASIKEAGFTEYLNTLIVQED